MNIANITGYKFTPITDTKLLQEKIINLSEENNLKGTVLISDKGINFSVAGLIENTSNFLKVLKKDEQFSDIDIKTTFNEYQPFRSKGRCESVWGPAAGRESVHHQADREE